jgi:predicted nucleotidyltransferase
VLEDRIVQDIVRALDARFGVDALWLFGSEATGRTTPDSDVDVAVLFTMRPAIEERMDLQSELAALVGRPVDLVDLDRASPILGMQVLRHGKLLLDRNPKRRVAFQVLLVSRYEDVRKMRAPAERAMLERMSHGRS